MCRSGELVQIMLKKPFYWCEKSSNFSQLQSTRCNRGDSVRFYCCERCEEYCFSTKSLDFRCNWTSTTWLQNVCGKVAPSALSFFRCIMGSFKRSDMKNLSIIWTSMTIFKNFQIINRVTAMLNVLLTLNICQYRKRPI